LYEYVHANKVCEAVKWLTKHSQLYKVEGIVVDDQWELSAQDDIDSNNDSDMENKMKSMTMIVIQLKRQRSHKTCLTMTHQMS
jgi:hypothetical protein